MILVLRFVGTAIHLHTINRNRAVGDAVGSIEVADADIDASDKPISSIQD